MEELFRLLKFQRGFLQLLRPESVEQSSPHFEVEGELAEAVAAADSSVVPDDVVEPAALVVVDDETASSAEHSVLELHAEPLAAESVVVDVDALDDISESLLDSLR